MIRSAANPVALNLNALANTSENQFNACMGHLL
jgi:hypothetical protein